MGCDIHINCEIKTPDGYWENCDFFTIDPTYKSLKGDPDCPPKWQIKEVNVGRNYTLFGVLAGVRDRSRPVISEPRGVPDDMSKQTKKRYLRESEWGCHSYSWLTLKELLDYKTQYENKYCCGYVTATGLEDINAYGVPDSEHVSQYKYAEYCYYASWRDEVLDSIDSFLDELYERLDWAFDIYDFYHYDVKSDLRRKASDKFRIVFWFDS